MSHRLTPNLAMLAAVAKGLKGLKERVVFVGGATIDLYLPESAPAARATDDVDCVVEIASRVKYNKLEEELRKLGFKHPTAERAPICRWDYSGIPVDVMPTSGEVLGFKNRWYADGMSNAKAVALPDGQMIEIFSVPYLLAAKIEAFQDRGRGDFLASRDMEDIITVLDVCPQVKDEMQQASQEVRSFLIGRFKQPRTGRAEKLLALLSGLAA